MDESVSFTMHLIDAKVVKVFGTKPWLGRRLPHLKRVTCGVKWSLPKRDFIPDEDVMVHPTVKLDPVRRGFWRVTVAKKYKQEAELFLIDSCM